eukprot:2834104-Prymnesium_polylepis.1
MAGGAGCGPGAGSKEALRGGGCRHRAPEGSQSKVSSRRDRSRVSPPARANHTGSRISAYTRSVTRYPNTRLIRAVCICLPGWTRSLERFQLKNVGLDPTSRA